MEATCAHCNAKTLFTREPVYDGFAKVGERWKCTACGAEVDDLGDASATPDPTAALTAVFGDLDTPEKIRIAGQDDPVTFCRYCVHYVVNAFTQRCAKHHKPVAATDSCSDFEPHPNSDEDAESSVAQDPF